MKLSSVRKKKKDPTDGYPVELPSTISAAEKENREADDKLAAMRKAKKKAARKSTTTATEPY
jgi:hypothetical protein